MMKMREKTVAGLFYQISQSVSQSVSQSTRERSANPIFFRSNRLWEADLQRKGGPRWSIQALERERKSEDFH
jgi:hypothetical protein